MKITESLLDRECIARIDCARLSRVSTPLASVAISLDLPHQLSCKRFQTEAGQ